MQTNKIPLWKLERYLLGELPSKELEYIKTCINSSLELQQELATLKNHTKHFHEKFDDTTQLQSIKKRATTPVPPTDRSSSSISGFSQTISLTRISSFVSMLVVILVISIYFIPENNHMIRAKGLAPHLLLFKKASPEPLLVSDQDTLTIGDIVQISYSAQSAKYGIIFSIDGNNTITLHYPQNKNTSPILKKDSLTALNFGYELDNAPHFERFYFLTTENSFSVDSLIKVIETGIPEKSGVLPLDVHFNQYFLTVIKK